MTLWEGRFSGKMDPGAWAFNTSIEFDRRLADQDVRSSRAWAEALVKAGVLTTEEGEAIGAGLDQIRAEIKSGEFVFKEADEDIHTAVERRLEEILGPVAGKLHTGRSRNDQVATDLRLWLLDSLPQLDYQLSDLQRALVERAESDFGELIPGYTHLQRAQPILLSHWWLAHFWPLHRDRDRLSALAERTSILPLGSAALAGTPFRIDRAALAADLGFDHPSPNSLDAVSDRDFVVEFLFCAALTGVHLSRLAEAVIIFSSAEFGFFELSDAYTTGSSLMPQKKNPDVFELARGKTGVLIGYLTGMLVTLKGLPSAYDKDLQEDKLPAFKAFDTLVAALPVLSGALRSLAIQPERMRAAIDPGMMAADLADYLVEKGLPFREAHRLVGAAVRQAAAANRQLDALSLEELRALHPAFDPDVHQVFDPQQSISRRAAIGGTAPVAVKAQLQQAKDLLTP